MFSHNDFRCLDSEYFDNDYDVVVMSRNTGHYWYLHDPGSPEPGTVVVFHKHRASHSYHLHGRAHSLRQAVRGIREHDLWQMNGRKMNS